MDRPSSQVVQVPEIQGREHLKTSAKGRLAVINGELINEATPEQEKRSELRTVWKDGKFVRVEPTTPGEFYCGDRSYVDIDIDPLKAFSG